MRADVVGELRTSVERQTGSRVEADKVGSDGLALAIETAGTQRDPANGADERHREQDSHIGARPLVVEPGAVAEPHRGPADGGDHVPSSRRPLEQFNLTPAGLTGA